MKVWRFFKEAFLYGVLLVSGVAFCLPVLWMIVTSVKVDREFMDTDQMLPQIPRLALVSPYLTEEDSGEAVAGTREHWEAEVRRIYGNAVPAAMVEAVGAEASLLGGNPAEMTRDQVQFLVDRAWDRNVRALLVRTPVLRSRERETFAYENAGGWHAEADHVEVRQAFQPDDEEARLIRYEFSEESGEDFSLRYLLQLEDEKAVASIDEIVLPVHADDSWHRVYLNVETAEGSWRSRSPFYLMLGSAGWADLSWRKASYPGSRLAYEFFKTLQMNGEGNSELANGQILLSVDIEQSNLMQAIWGKISRNYEMVFAAMPFARYLWNSFILVVLNSVAAIFSCSLAGYAFARLRWRGRQVYFIIMLATMTIPPQVTMVPTFIIIRHLGLYNTYFPLVLPSMIAVPFFVFLLRQFLMNIPRDLEDAALIDGCSHLRIYWHIMLPLIRPTLVIVAIFTFIATWNDFLGPLIYLSDQELYPVSLGIFAFQSYAGGVGLGSPAVMMAASTLMILPVIAVFFFAQRYFTEGIKMTGIK